ncbi:hypothetical protein PEX1_059330 [Penicillium expansum]|uniref:Uncharacterized protein n=1 Tax=Penicillium expansum TaxID=27334 RepID=A0A0A2KRU3_PENEN|nr:hypothetical protein PEX2_089400 [Penicillium expansum]KGO40380.1 hypothetical protein PEXP_031950 [Penicillium expansum]KGO54955.1 hypothetical protein PEX2_089400 [Penicillium expansum]KGO70489.1 hypothetical protein PEX1_059330 [Penicillium expansum]
MWASKPESSFRMVLKGVQIRNGGAEDQFRNNSAQAVKPAFRQSSLKHKGEAITDQETDLVVLQSRSGVCSGTIGYPSKFPQCKVNIRATIVYGHYHARCKGASGKSAPKMQAQLNMSAQVDKLSHEQGRLQPIVTCNCEWVRQTPISISLDKEYSVERDGHGDTWLCNRNPTSNRYDNISLDEYERAKRQGRLRWIGTSSLDDLESKYG